MLGAVVGVGAGGTVLGLMVGAAVLLPGLPVILATVHLGHVLAAFVALVVLAVLLVLRMRVGRGGGRRRCSSRECGNKQYKHLKSPEKSNC